MVLLLDEESDKMNSLCTTLEPFDCAVFTIMGNAFLYSASTLSYLPLTDCARDILIDCMYLKTGYCSNFVVEKYRKNEIELTLKKIGEFRSAGIIAPYHKFESTNIQFGDFYLKLIPTLRCNLKCSYCFCTSKTTESDMSVETAKTAIDFFIMKFAAPGGRIIVDFTGAGEPLLRLDFILKVNEYVLLIKQKKHINIFSQFASNGMLLTPEVSSILKKNMILYGVSLDGDREESCRARKGLNYDLVIKNIVDMENKQYFGLAATYSGNNYNLINIFETLYKLGPEAIGMKPVRLLPDENGAITMDNIDVLKQSYNKFCLWLIEHIVHDDERLVSVLLSGEDYFVRFLKIVIRHSRLFYRCSSGLSSIAVDSSGNILICPAFVNSTSQILGNIYDGINFEAKKRFQSYYADKISYCEKCWARYACGGECFSVGYSNNKELVKPVKAMCELKKYLIQLSVYFWLTLQYDYPESYRKYKAKCM